MRDAAPQIPCRFRAISHRAFNPFMRASYHRLASGELKDSTIFQAADFTRRTSLRLPLSSRGDSTTISEPGMELCSSEAASAQQNRN
jgi:hypothetical protein